MDRYNMAVRRTTKAVAKPRMSVDELIAVVNDRLGDGVVFKADDPSLDVGYISTGMLPIDIMLHGGFPTGRMTEIYGDYSPLKSVVCLGGAATALRNGGTAALIDTEKTFEPKWARKLGIDPKRLIIWPPRDDDREHTGEEAMDTAQMLIANGVDFLGFDSVSAALPQQESAKRMHGESLQPGRLAQLMSSGLRRLNAANSHTAICFVNQTRMNIGITFGSPEVTTGGKALPFYASFRLAIRKTGKVTEDARVFNGEKWVVVKRQTAQMYKAEMMKSKLSKPFGECFFTWDLSTGQIDHPGFLINEGLNIGGIVIKGNTWQTTDGSVKIVGKDKFKAAFADNRTALRAIERAVRESHGLTVDELTPLPPVQKSLGRGAPRKSTGKRLRRA